MSGGLNRLLAAAVVAAAVVVVPPAALADGCGGGPSAMHVYKECLGSGGGGKPTSGGGGKPTSGGRGPTSGGTQTGTSSPYISKHTAKALQKAGQDGKSLSHLVKGFGPVRLLQSQSSAAAQEPTAVGSAFDLGSGPTALLIVLAGTAILLLGGSGFRAVRRR